MPIDLLVDRCRSREKSMLSRSCPITVLWRQKLVRNGGTLLERYFILRYDEHRHFIYKKMTIPETVGDRLRIPP